MQTSVPAILVWYGNQQSFGKLGNPQHWVNILGNVSGSPLKSLTYSLNGAPPLALAIGTSLSPPGSAACPEVSPKPLDAKSRDFLSNLWNRAQRLRSDCKSDCSHVAPNGT